MHEISKYFIHIWILDHECAHVVVVASTAFQVPRSDNSRRAGASYNQANVTKDFAVGGAIMLLQTIAHNKSIHIARNYSYHLAPVRDLASQQATLPVQNH